MSDEVHFYLDDFINKQNCRIWSTHSHVKFTVWCEIIGPFFFEDDDFVIHIAKQTMKPLSYFFGNRIILRGSAFEWPPWSSDLTAPDFFHRVCIDKVCFKENIRKETKALTPK